MQFHCESSEHIDKAGEARKQFRSSVSILAAPFNGDVTSKDEVLSQPNVKLVHFVRHGQGYHNLLADVARNLGAKFSGSGDYEAAIRDNSPYLHPGIHDPPLTSIGREDAKALRQLQGNECIQPELYVVSPMKRATQTILIGFQSHIESTCAPVIAHEGCREQMVMFLSLHA